MWIDMSTNSCSSLRDQMATMNAWLASHALACEKELSVLVKGLKDGEQPAQVKLDTCQVEPRYWAALTSAALVCWRMCRLEMFALMPWLLCRWRNCPFQRNSGW